MTTDLLVALDAAVTDQAAWSDIVRKLSASGGGDGGRAARQVRQLVDLVLRRGRAGADLRSEAYAVADEAPVRLWLDQSEYLADHLPGPPRLRKQRIRGELRILYGAWQGMGISRPRLPEATRERETKLFARRDELLWHPVEGIWTPRGWRPLQERLESETARAMIFMRARAFERSVWKDLVPGKLPRSRGERLLFDAEEFLSSWWTRRRFREFR
jgi:hypothetical protein